jgi:hypothetical protein
MDIVFISIILFVLCFSVFLVFKLEERNKRIKSLLEERFKDGYTFDKIMATKGFKVMFIRLYADNKYWELEVDKDKGITQEKILINQN